MSYPKPDPAETGTWPDPGEMETLPDAATWKRNMAILDGLQPIFDRNRNAVTDVLAAAFAKRGRK